MMTEQELIEACPTPVYHETHRYCPSCPWTEEREAATQYEDRVSAEVRKHAADLFAAWGVEAKENAARIEAVLMSAVLYAYLQGRADEAASYPFVKRDGQR